jgi:hypothetical protein
MNDAESTGVFRSAAAAVLGPAAVHEAPQSMGAEDFAWSALALELLDPSNASAGVPIHRA